MPVKWDPAMDQLLLLKILETVWLPSRSELWFYDHDLKVDVKKISESWPDDQKDKPTPRAITERLVKIRSNARSVGAGNFGISSSQSKGPSPSKPRAAPSAPATPSKSTKFAKGGTNNSTPSKRKKPDDVPVKLESDDIEVIGQFSTPKKDFQKRTSSGHNLADLVNNPDSLLTPTKDMDHLSMGSNEHDEEEEVESPSKRPRRASAVRTTAYASDRDAGAESDVSEFHGGFDGADEEELAV
ncbi:MAG: hypothetical protein Q9162_001276 [Coniocarpon cinnabarinum]